ncbi:MAG TPA: dihydrofolate reductase family protein [Candidatus Nanoarchaeia archaeon]|nr:dihydrofolate reductase family protein [Candidatus Nanoarchaeia archaeon]
MLPKIIIHNSVSADGSLTGFEVNMGLHYDIAGNYKPDAHLIGSNTAKTGIDTYGGRPETKSDLVKPSRDKELPYWAIIDTEGKLKGHLHNLRGFEYCKDVIVFVSKATPQSYLDYLKERDYDHHVLGNLKVDLKKALVLLYDNYKVRKILTDTGRILSNLLIEEKLADELSLLIHPVLVGEKSYKLFSVPGELRLVKSEVLEKDFVWSTYEMGK